MQKPRFSNFAGCSVRVTVGAEISRSKHRGLASNERLTVVGFNFVVARIDVSEQLLRYRIALIGQRAKQLNRLKQHGGRGYVRFLADGANRLLWLPPMEVVHEYSRARSYSGFFRSRF